MPGQGTFPKLFEMVMLIHRHPKTYTARDLAEHFRTTERTIYRDIRKIEDSGIRVESEIPGGYFIMQDMGRLPISLSSVEQLAVKLIPWLMESRTSGSVVPQLQDAYLSALQKMANRSGQSGLTDGAAQLGQRILTDSAGNSPAATEDTVIGRLLEALAQQVTVEMEYYSFASETITTRQVDPYFLVPRNHSLYMIGFCHHRTAYRTFKLSRIRRVTPIGKKFVLDPEISLDSYLKTAWEIDESGEVMMAHLAFLPQVRNYVMEEVPPSRRITEWTDERNRYCVSMEVRMNHEFLRWIRQYGADVEVLSPLSLRNRVQFDADRVLAQYVSSTQ